MWNVEPAMQRGMPPELERRYCRRPTPQEVASGRAYMDPRVRGTGSYVAGEENFGDEDRRSPVLEDARVDSRTYLTRHRRDRRI